MNSLRAVLFADLHHAHLSRTIFSEASLHGGTGKFTKRVGGNPASGGRIEFTNFFRDANRGVVQREISFADIAKRPVHRFFYEVAIVAGFALNDRK